jgi:hypothetical protein
MRKISYLFLCLFLLNTAQAKDGIVNYFKLFGSTNVHGETEPCG